MYLLFLARRYMLARWIMSGAAVALVMLAVFVLIVVRSVFQGFGDQMRDMVRGTSADLVLASAQPMDLPYANEIAADIEKLPHVTGASPYIETMAMFQAQSRSGPYTDYLQVKGVDTTRERTIGKFAHYLLRDEVLLAALEHQKRPLAQPAERTPLSGEEIARLFGPEHRDKVWQIHKNYYLRYAPDKVALWEKKLPPPVVIGIQALVGDRPLTSFGAVIQLTTYSPRKGEVKTGEFLVVGAFHTGLFENDRRSLYMPLGAACEFIDLYDPELPDADGFPAGGWRVSGVEISLDDYDRFKEPTTSAVRTEIAARYSARVEKAGLERLDLGTMSWEERKDTLLRAVEVEKGIVTLIIGVLVLFVGAIIFLMLTLNVIEKRRDIGILKAVGSVYEYIFALFLIHGGTICLLGLVLGFAGGLAFCEHINTIHDWIYGWTGWRLFPPDIYYMDRIPVSIKLWDLVQISCFTVLCGFLGSLLPAHWAARQDPIAAIHSE